MKQFVPELLHNAGRSTIHSAEVRRHSLHAADTVAVLLRVTSEIVSVNLPFAKFTAESIRSPGFTGKTFTDGAGNISYQAK